MTELAFNKGLLKYILKVKLKIIKGLCFAQDLGKIKMSK